MGVRMSMHICNNYRKPRRAFTLIEVLVVVAIIALLVAILIPSLQRAREQALIASCMANCKQIGGITATYQAEYKGYVPVIFNAGSAYLGHFNDALDVDDSRRAHNANPARNMWLPVAFSAYDKGTKNMVNATVSPGVELRDDDTPFFRPKEKWQPPKMRDFVDRLMPDYYACPFVREKLTEDDVFEIVRTWQTCYIYEIKGRISSYNTWQWEGRVTRGVVPIAFNRTNLPDHFPPYDPDPNTPVIMGDGRPKYSVLSWNFNGRSQYANLGYIMPPGFGGDNLKNRHRKWDATDAQRQKAAGLSDVTVVYCHGGMNLTYQRRIKNMESHRTNLGAGTNAIFADTHVDWVKGTQIGWQ